MVAEHAIGHNKVAHGSRGADSLGVEVVQGLGAAVEGGRVVAVEHLLRALAVGTLVADGHGDLAADDDLAAHGVVAHGRELETCQTAVAGNAYGFYHSLTLAVEFVGIIDAFNHADGVKQGVALADWCLSGNHLVAQLRVDGVIDGIGNLHRKAIAQRHHNHAREHRQGGLGNERRRHAAFEVEGTERNAVEGGFAGVERSCSDFNP